MYPGGQQFPGISGGRPVMMIQQQQPRPFVVQQQQQPATMYQQPMMVHHPPRIVRLQPMTMQQPPMMMQQQTISEQPPTIMQQSPMVQQPPTMMQQTPVAKKVKPKIKKETMVQPGGPVCIGATKEEALEAAVAGFLAGQKEETVAPPTAADDAEIDNLIKQMFDQVAQGKEVAYFEDIVKMNTLKAAAKGKGFSEKDTLKLKKDFEKMNTSHTGACTLQEFTVDVRRGCIAPFQTGIFKTSHAKILKMLEEGLEENRAAGM